jgi:predicted AlkP superfamily pyrophosphatase or phosphodiesterase
MRYDYLYRYWNKYGEGGFKKLLKEGFSCDNTNINYVPTYTAPGHSAIYTGTTPSTNGIVGNEWYERESGNVVYCAADPNVDPVGTTDKRAGSMSPWRLLSNTVTDELLLSNNFRSKVIGISLKDRGAIMPAGHRPTAAYWYEEKTGKFISSTWYMKQLPAWVDAFNKNDEAGKFISQPWDTLKAKGPYIESNRDNMPYEEAFKGEDAPVFPHKLQDLPAKYELLKETPFGNTLLKDFAKETIKNEKLGQSDVTDFLTVSFSATDGVGHRFGPNSIEVEDTYLRLDEDLEDLINYLQQTLGKDNVLIFLTADHGAIQNSQYLQEHHLPGGNFSSKKLKDTLGVLLSSTYGQGEYISKYINQNIYLNYNLLTTKGLKVTDVENKIAGWLTNMQGVSYVLPVADISTAQGDINTLLRNGYTVSRSGDVMVVLKPGWVEDKAKGTTHGSGYNYDTHIPLLWYGWNIKPGSTSEPVSVTDIAPTLSRLLNISFPGGCTGKAIPAIAP